MNRFTQNYLVQFVSDKKILSRKLAIAIRYESKPNWKIWLGNLRNFLITGIPCNSIIAQGNSKLSKSILAFSELPGKGFCPGAGNCLNYCYSYKAWRYPQAFTRQVQNHILLNSEKGRSLIAEDLRKKSFTAKYFRLYVDGDFRNAEILQFWFNLLPTINIQAYGYSKSLELLLKHKGNWPENYILNLSGGHKYSPEIESRISKLPIYRGKFLSVNLGRKVNSSEFGTKALLAELKSAYAEKAFVCPGKCYKCLPGSIHACGNKSVIMPIIIAEH